MRNFILAATTLVFASLASPFVNSASAVEYPYCAAGVWAGGGGCSYATLEQCRAAISGGGGSCVPNARYTAGENAVARTPRPRR